MRTDSRQRNKLEKRQSGDNLMALVYHNPPDLKEQPTIKFNTNHNRCDSPAVSNSPRV